MKSITTRKIGTKDICQTSFYDHVIRNDEDYQTRFRYIKEKPCKMAAGQILLPRGIKMQEYIHVKGAREHNLKKYRHQDSARQAGGVHRPVGSRVNRRWRSTPSTPRASAALRRVAVELCAVSGPDGQAGCGLHRRSVARHFPSTRRPPLTEPAFDGRHGHRDLRLYAPAVGAHRYAALPEMRQGDPPADHRPDHRPADGARGNARAAARASHPEAKGRAR